MGKYKLPNDLDEYRFTIEKDMKDQYPIDIEDQWLLYCTRSIKVDVNRAGDTIITFSTPNDSTQMNVLENQLKEAADKIRKYEDL